MLALQPEFCCSEGSGRLKILHSLRRNVQVAEKPHCEPVDFALSIGVLHMVFSKLIKLVIRLCFVEDRNVCQGHHNHTAARRDWAVQLKPLGLQCSHFNMWLKEEAETESRLEVGSSREPVCGKTMLLVSLVPFFAFCSLCNKTA